MYPRTPFIKSAAGMVTARSNGLVVKALDSLSRGTVFKINRWVYEVGQMSTWNFWELSGKK